MLTRVLDTYSPEWDAFVRSVPEGRLCHLQEWGAMIARTFGHTCFHVVAQENEEIGGVLPLVLLRSRLFGTRLISQAFSNYGGPLLRDATALGPLLVRAIQLAAQFQCRYLELRAAASLSREFHLHCDKVCMHLPLAGDPEELQRQFKPEIRNRIRKAEKSGLTAIDGGEELVDDFYRTWTLRMQQLGTPCYPRQLFTNLLRSFPEYARVFLVKHGRATVGAGFFYHFNDLVQCRWAATDVAFNHLSPNTLLYWSAMKHYCQAGVRRFDFGRSTIGSSQYEFKRRWGAEAVQLYYQFWSPAPQTFEMVSPDSPRYRRQVAVWKRLPVSITRFAGPYLSRSLG